MRLIIIHGIIFYNSNNNNNNRNNNAKVTEKLLKIITSYNLLYTRVLLQFVNFTVYSYT